MHCLGERSCASVNYKTSGIDKGLCELNSKTLQETSDAGGRIHNPEFNHIYIFKKKREKLVPSTSTPPWTTPKSSTGNPTEKVTRKVSTATPTTSTSTLKTTGGLTIQPTTTSNMKNITTESATTYTPKRADGPTTQPTTKSTQKTTEGSTTQQTTTSKLKKTAGLTTQPTIIIATSTPIETGGLTTQPTAKSTPKTTDYSLMILLTAQQTRNFTLNQLTSTSKNADASSTQSATTSTPKETNGLTTQPSTRSTPKTTDDFSTQQTTQQTTTSTPKKTDDSTVTSTSKKTGDSTTQPTTDQSFTKKTDGYKTQQTTTFSPKKTESLTTGPLTASTPKKTDASTTQTTYCTKTLRLGMENGEILDAQITASSKWANGYGADNARLNLQRPEHSHAWVPSAASGSWLQVDFELQATISEVLTQGRGDFPQWVESYNLSYSSNGVDFHPYRQNGVVKVFPGNRDQNTIVHQDISPVIVARYIRILPQTWRNNVALRVDFSGCLKAARQLLSSCKELLETNRSLTSGNYALQNKDSHSKYNVYCHMVNISGCGRGGWTLVMKVDGKETTFKSDSLYWNDKRIYEVENGLEGLTDKQTKLASYWNTPFQKICLGMKVEGDTETDIKWIAIDHQASSLFDVIADDNFTATNITKSKWKSLINGSSVQQNCNTQGFNIRGGESNWKMHVRIGLVANDETDCNTCNSCIGFGISVTACGGRVKKNACGNIHACKNLQNDIAAFGYILVQ